MTGIPFETIAAAALNQAESLLFRWFPAGVVEGHEFRIGDIHGTPGKSLSVNLRTGAWCEFSGGIKGGDLTALFAAKFHGGKQGPAAIELARDLGVGLNGYSHGHTNGHANGHAGGYANGAAKPAPKPGKKADVWQPMIPPPEHAKPPSDAAFRGFDHVFKYTSLDGKLTHYVLRIDAKNGEEKKIRPLTYGSLNGREGWCIRHPANPLPLFGLHKLSEMPDAGVILHEGEKKCRSGQLLFPECAHLAWARGADNVDCADFEPLTGRQVTLWPDADAAGRKAAQKIMAKLDIEFIVNTEGLPEKFDCADLLAMTEAGQVADAAAWLRERLMKVEPREDVEDGDDAEPGRGMGLTGKGARNGINQAIAKLNEQYMVVSEAGRTVIYRPEFEPILKRHTYTRMSFGDFKNLFMNKSLRVGTDAQGDPTYKPISNIWLKSPNRREYPNGITFDPTGQHAEGKLNLWRGFSVEERPGNWTLMKDHVRTIVCDGNEAYYEWVLDWAAKMVQHPAEAGQVAVVMKGGQGTGKGIFARALIRLLSHHALAIAHTKHLVGNFNSHLRDIVLLFADEAFFAGDRAHIGVLNSLITEPYLAIEGKGQNLVTVPNYLHVIMASNEEWVVPASLDARRYFVLLVSDARKGDHAYFKAINDQMEAGGYEAMLHELKHRDISNFNVRAVPVTEGLVEQRKLSLPVAEAWWKDCLERGYVFQSKIGLEETFSVWMNEVSTSLLFASYTEFAKQRGERRPMSREALGHFMRRMVGDGSGRRLANAPVGEHIVDVTITIGGTQRDKREAAAFIQPRPMGFLVNSLDIARSLFQTATGLAVVWHKGDWDKAD